MLEIQLWILNGVQGTVVGQVILCVTTVKKPAGSKHVCLSSTTIPQTCSHHLLLPNVKPLSDLHQYQDRNGHLLHMFWSLCCQWSNAYTVCILADNVSRLTFFTCPFQKCALGVHCLHVWSITMDGGCFWTHAML